ncbi:MAG: C4-dicarboxylate transporter substrate-binding protein [Enterovirga sp.]|nr:C4-dicarboxylate transporter substrate-binding protein [Enterovirga sp.]
MRLVPDAGITMPLRLVIGLTFALGLLSSPAVAQTGSVRLTLGTATSGGGFPAYGEALVAALGEIDAGVVVDTRATGGSQDNLVLLREGRLDLALVQGEYAFAALGPQGGSDGRALSVVAPVYATPGLFVVPAASSIRSVADLRGRPVALGTRDSGLTVLGRAVLQASGLDVARDVQAVFLDRAGDGPAMVLDGRVDALWGAGLDWPGFRTLAATPGGARFVGPSEAAIAALLQRRPSLRRLTVPAGAFPNQAEPIDTVGSWSLVLARPGLDEAAVLRFVRAVDRAVPVLARRLRQGGESASANLSRAVPAEWLHPGTRRALAEAPQGR